MALLGMKALTAASTTPAPVASWTAFDLVDDGKGTLDTLTVTTTQGSFLVRVSGVARFPPSSDLAGLRLIVNVDDTAQTVPIVRVEPLDKGEQFVPFSGAQIITQTAGETDVVIACEQLGGAMLRGPMALTVEEVD